MFIVDPIYNFLLVWRIIMYFILYQCSAETKIGVVDIKTESVQFHV